MKRVEKRTSLALLVAVVAASCASSSRYAVDDDASPVAYGAGSDGGGGAPTADAPRAAHEVADTVSVEESILDDVADLFGGAAPAAKVAQAPPPPPPPPPAAPAPAGTSTPGADAPQVDAPPPAPSKRLMIYRASYALLVADVDASIQDFLKSVDEAGGYLEGRQGESVTVRVPAARFQALVDALPGFGRVTSQSLQAQDVTKQFLDLAIRIENAEASRRRLLELLKQAQKMEDILAIEGEVRRLSEEIERMKGEQRFLSDQIAFSTIHVLFQANAPKPMAWAERRASRFDWVNRIGFERVLRDF